MKSLGGAFGRLGGLTLSLLVALYGFGSQGSSLAVELLSVRNQSLAPRAGANGDSVAPGISPDGRFVVFSSTAGNLVTNDNAWPGTDVFLRDRASNTTVLISENLQKTGGGNDHSTALAVSTNGRYVLFESVANDLVAGDTNGLVDLFVRDALMATTHLINVASNGAAGSDVPQYPTMTPDGRYVVFASAATNLVAGDTNGLRDVFIRDLMSNITILVSTNSKKATRSFSITGPLLPPEAPVVTPEGRCVAFLSTNDLSTGVPFTTTPYGSVGEVYVRDLIAGVTTWVSSNAFSLAFSNLSGTKFLISYHPSISTDGRYVAFKTSFADRAGITAIFRKDLVTDELVLISTNGVPQGNGLRAAVVDEIFGPEMSSDGRFVAYGNRVNGTNFYSIHVWDALAGTNYLISGSPAGVAQTNAHSYAPVFSADGRYVAFISDATNLVANTIASGPHLYRRDLVANVTELLDVSQGGAGMSADFMFDPPSLSANGQWVAFSAGDGDFVTGDSGEFEDVFVRNVSAGTNELISVPNAALTTTAADAAALPGLLSMSAAGGRVAFSTIASNQIAGDDNREADVFVWDRASQSNQLVSVGLDALPARGGATVNPLLSADGRYVVFVSAATNLVATDTNGQYDIFLRDLELQQTTRISVMTNDVSLASFDPPVVAMTPDARFVVFMARTNATGSTYPLFWRDLVSGQTKQVSGSIVSTRNLSLSANGQRVAYFAATTGNLLVWDAGSGMTVFGNASATGSASLSPSGSRVLYQIASQLICYDLNVQSNLSTWPGTVSVKNSFPWGAEERWVALTTASALVASDTNGVNDVYLCDLQTGTRTLISAHADGATSGSAASDTPIFSADGRFIVYRSQATNLLAASTIAPGLFAFDRITGSNQLLVAKSALPGLGWLSVPVVSSNGAFIAFKTADAGLVAGDWNRSVDAFSAGVTVLSTADSDADGIPDWWLQQYFGHTNGQANDLSRPGDDADGDGLTNAQEFFVGTDPADAAAALELQITLTPPTGTNVVLSWPAQAGKDYRVQFSDDVAANNWQNLTTPVQVLGGQGRVTVMRTNQNRVFRVRCEE